MKTVYRILSILLMLFNTTGAFFGSYKLISDPTGKSLQMPLSVLQNTPFKDFLIPGIMLLCVNGVFGFITIILTLLRLKNYSQFIFIQGMLLTGWIVMQMMMLNTFANIQFLYGCIGIVIMICGAMLTLHEKEKNTAII